MNVAARIRDEDPQSIDNTADTTAPALPKITSGQSAVIIAIIHALQRESISAYVETLSWPPRRLRSGAAIQYDAVSILHALHEGAVSTCHDPGMPPGYRHIVECDIALPAPTDSERGAGPHN